MYLIPDFLKRQYFLVLLVSMFKGVKYLISPSFLPFADCSIVDMINYAFLVFNFSLLLSAQEIACLSKATVKKRIILSSRRNSVSKLISASPVTVYSNKW